MTTWKRLRARTNHRGWTITIPQGRIDIFAWHIESKVGENWRWVFIPTGSYKSTLCGFAETDVQAKIVSLREIGL